MHFENEMEENFPSIQFLVWDSGCKKKCITLPEYVHEVFVKNICIRPSEIHIQTSTQVTSTTSETANVLKF